MNAYLTKKASHSKLAWIPIGFSALMGIVGFTVIFEDCQRQPEISQIILELILCVLFLLPLFFKIRKIRRVGLARKLAFGFSQCLDADISYEEMGMLTGLSEVEARTMKLLELGYLQNVIVDMKERKFFLYAPNTESQQQRILGVQCPSCGGANQAVVGKLNTCEFCGAPLTVTGTAQPDLKNGRSRKR